MAVPAPTDKRFRRAHVSPTARSRVVISLKSVAIAAVATSIAVYACFSVAAFAMSSDLLTVTRITVSGNTRLSDGEVMSLLDGLQGRNMFTVDLDEWREKLLASPWVADAVLRRVLPGAIDAAVSEREPIAIGRVGNTLHLIDETGSSIDEFGPHHADLDLPVVSGLSTVTGRGQVPIIEASRAALAARLLLSLQRRPDLAARVSEVDVSDPRNAVVILKGDATQVRLGEDQFIERLQSYLDIAPTIRDQVSSNLDYVDLRFGPRIFTRPVGGRDR